MTIGELISTLEDLPEWEEEIDFDTKVCVYVPDGSGFMPIEDVTFWEETKTNDGGIREGHVTIKANEYKCFYEDLKVTYPDRPRLFRKKPVVVDAEQWFSSQPPETYPECLRFDVGIGAYVIDTLEGAMKVSDGDWIITGVKGEKYPCKPDIFEATYELVDR